MTKIKVIYGTEWCGDCVRSTKYLAEHNVPYKWIDIDSDVDGKRKTIELNKGKARVPTIVFEDGTILVEPTNRELKKKLKE